ncbi:MAG: hypothetical protein Q4B68_05915 [Bacteroidales bacterium]|nr:hypothetical protein [Bacteroidales bacterium]
MVAARVIRQPLSNKVYNSFQQKQKNATAIAQIKKKTFKFATITKININAMKRICFFLSLFCLLLASCNGDEKLGPSPSWTIEWEANALPSQIIYGAKYYNIPQEGGDYTFVSLSGNLVKTWEQCARTNINDVKSWEKTTLTQATIQKKNVTVSISPNDSTTRYIEVHFQNEWQVDGVLRFAQEGIK